MSAPVPPPRQPLTLSPLERRPPTSRIAVVALTLASVLAMLWFGARIAAVALNSAYGTLDDEDYESLAATGGLLGILAIVPILIVLGLAIRAIDQSSVSGKGGFQAAVALGLTALQGLMWLSRMVSATISSFADDNVRSFLSYVFLWT